MMNQHQRGFALIALFAFMIPMLLIVGAFSMLMSGRTSEMLVELDQARALLAAESGIDDAIYRGRIGTLVGSSAYDRNLGTGLAFRVEPTYLKTDGNDNDGDGNIDEADEDVYQVIVTGTYRNTKRRLAAYLGPVPLLPTLEMALGTQDPGVSIRLQGTPLISGHDTNIDGSPGGASMPGLTIAPPGTVADLLSELTASEQAKVVGDGPTPSLDVGPSIDLPTLVAQIQNIANLVLTSKNYASYDFGNGALGTANITYREGDLKFMGNSRGAGILVVTGNLEITGTFRFDGVIIAMGKVVNSSGTADVYGSILQGPGGGVLEIKGTANLRYSSQAIALANSLSGQYVAFNGWQEIASD